MFNNFLFSFQNSKSPLDKEQLFMFCQNGQWDDLLNYAKAQPGNCCRLLDVSDVNGNTIFHIIAKEHPHPYKFTGQLLSNISYRTSLSTKRSHEWLNRENLKGETFNTLCEEKKQDLYKELMPNLQVQCRFFR